LADRWETDPLGNPLNPVGGGRFHADSLTVIHARSRANCWAKCWSGGTAKNCCLEESLNWRRTSGRTTPRRMLLPVPQNAIGCCSDRPGTPTFISFTAIIIA